MAAQKPFKDKAGGQKYRESYTTTWPFIEASSKGVQFVYCKVCRTDFSIKHSGMFDIKKHIGTTKHATASKLRSSNQSVLSFVNSPKADKSGNRVTQAECIITNFIIEHNLPLAISDHLSKVLPHAFPDSDIAKSYGCKRTKTTHLVHHMGKFHQKQLVNLMLTMPFALMTDGSSDRGVEAQMYPMMTRVYSKSAGRIVTQLLSMPECKSSCTGENIFDLMDQALKEQGLRWDHCVAYGSDNAAVMMGKKNGVAAFVRRKHENIFVSGCTCHLVNLTVSKALSALPVDVAEVLIDIFYYLEKSSKRKQHLREFQEVHCTDGHAILKHCPTRWLSLQNCLARLLEQIEPLTEFFAEESRPLREKAEKKLASENSENQPPNKKRKTANGSRSCDKTELKKYTVQPKATKVYFTLIDHRTKLYSLFLQSQLPTFCAFNLILQRDEPLIHQLRSRCIDLVTCLLVKFVKPDIISSASDITTIPYNNRDSQKAREQLVIGTAVQDFLVQCKADSSMTSDDRSEFFSAVRKFYAKALDYVLDKFPLNDNALIHAEVADITKRKAAKFESLSYFVKRFPCLLPDASSETTDRLQMEFLR